MQRYPSMRRHDNSRCVTFHALCIQAFALLQGCRHGRPDDGCLQYAHRHSIGADQPGGQKKQRHRLGSVQLEFVHLSSRTGNSSYGMVAERIIEFLHDKYKDQVGWWSVLKTLAHT
jgi:hypothetical protein